MHPCLGRHTVNDIKGIIVVQCPDTPYPYGGRTARITVRGNVHSRDLSLHCLDRVVFIKLGKIVHIDDGNRAGQVCLALDGIACHYRFLQHLHILFHDHGHHGRSSHGNILVAD